MSLLKLSAPWVLIYRQINAMFAKDPDIRVVFDEENAKISLYAADCDKAAALDKILIGEYTFGNVKLSVNVVLPNGSVPKTKTSTADLFAAALAKNRALSYIRAIEGVFSNDITYIVFANEVVQYFSDDLSDINGLCSTLYQDIAKSIFKEIHGVYFCTDVLDGNGISFGRPVGE